MAKVELQNVTREFDQVVAIENISFIVPDGEFWVLVGPSGCGKSTILRAIAGLETITQGKLYIDDILVNQIPARQRDVAMVFQNYALYPHMSVAENLAFGLKMRKVPRNLREEKVENIAVALSISHLLKRKPKQLSGGQQQRVALGRAIVREPKVFLLDEPLSNLDAQLRDQTRTELKQLHQQVGITTVYVTHDQVEAMTLADQIVVLDRGRIQQIGTPQEIYAHPVNRMVATFLGSPSMNIFPGTYQQRQLLIHNQRLSLNPELANRFHLDSGRVFDLGIRPEAIELVSESEGLAEGNQLDLIVRLIEPLGHHTLIQASIPETELVVNFYVPANWRGRVSDRLKVKLKLEELFIFAVDSGKCLN
ncbi:ABC transporter ATP-binding protein [Gloeocapsa sp. PCC 73106]|uniref:ABC transporter ATP-binding protein n=1 Tax=Gloeocapsa sp. PCC 73106 TaxID=102232 RepID=UPI0002AC7B99|nr:sn-glycerol-3-phosphate ABC transporter ATP-binding protein UgpC [Gloeocapsa sp. PCC 73106]ELR99364.1 ATPase component of ABC-type sugar transporter [Gloeocapsa sp. PCC 73106]